MQAVPSTASAEVRRNKDKLARFVAINSTVARSDEVRAAQFERAVKATSKWLVSELDIELSAVDFSEATHG